METLASYQKITTSLNNLIDILYIFLKVERYDDLELNEYVYNRTRNNIVFLNNMLHFLTVRNQALELADANPAQKLYQTYLVNLTTLLYELNKSLVILSE